jgi:hypothetical protein
LLYPLLAGRRTVGNRESGIGNPRLNPTSGGGILDFLAARAIVPQFPVPSSQFPVPSGVPDSRKQVSEFISRFDPAIAKLVRAARAKLRKRFPTAIELVYDNYNALAIGFGPTEKTSDAILSLAVYARGVNLYFLRGATLPDRDRLLEGKGTQGRFLRLTSAAQLDDPKVSALVDVAAAHGRIPMAVKARGYTIVKSVSAKQRPRRPNRST